MATTSLTGPPGNTNWWTAWLQAHEAQEYTMFLGFLYAHGLDGQALDNTQLDAQYSAFVTKMTNDGAASMLIPVSKGSSNTAS
jgi:hypothetical protein